MSSGSRTPHPIVPSTIDGRPAVETSTTTDGRTVFQPLRNPSNPGEGVSPFPHFTRSADGQSGHSSDLVVHTHATPTVPIRMRQEYVGFSDPSTPKSRNDRYVALDGVPQRKSGGVFTPALEPPISPRTRTNTISRATKITFK